MQRLVTKGVLSNLELVENQLLDIPVFCKNAKETGKVSILLSSSEPVTN